VSGRVRAHGVGGHAGHGAPVESGVTTVHHPTDQTQHPTTPSRMVLPRPAQCLRHHKWMAACTDCKDARGTDRPHAAASR
jgi:hypothetical protein